MDSKTSHLSKVIFEGVKDLKGKIALAVSGGIDSMVLLHAVSQLRCKKVAMDSLVVLHIDHGICQESHNWANMVQKTCDDYALEVIVSKVKGLYVGMPNLEKVARDLRHEELHRLCIEHGASTLLLAHHAVDQVETVLMNLFRGSGLSGMGMPKSRAMVSKTNPGEVLLFKPFLSIVRSHIEDYANHYSLSWIEDPSNRNISHRRNRIRHGLLPVIRSVDERAFSNILKFSEIALNSASIEKRLVNIIIKEHVMETGSYSIINWRELCKYDDDIKKIIIRTWFSNIGIMPPTSKKLTHILSEFQSCNDDNSTIPIFSFNHDGRDFLKMNGVMYVCK